MRHCASAVAQLLRFVATFKRLRLNGFYGCRLTISGEMLVTILRRQIRYCASAVAQLLRFVATFKVLRLNGFHGCGLTIGVTGES